jgi:hypothetical protein
MLQEALGSCYGKVLAARAAAMGRTAGRPHNTASKASPFSAGSSQVLRFVELENHSILGYLNTTRRLQRN